MRKYLLRSNSAIISNFLDFMSSKRTISWINVENSNFFFSLSIKVLIFVYWVISQPHLAFIVPNPSETRKRLAFLVPNSFSKSPISNESHPGQILDNPFTLLGRFPQGKVCAANKNHSLRHYMFFWTLSE